MKLFLPLAAFLILLSNALKPLNAQTVTSYSVLSTAYDRSSGSFLPLGAVDNGWFLTSIQDLSVPLDPSTYTAYPEDPTYVVINAGNNTFPGMIQDHSINHTASTASGGKKMITYRTYFTLPNLASSPYQYMLNFKMSADDAVDHVDLNGVKKGQFLDANFNNIPGLGKPHILSIPVCDNSFRSGQNVIDVTIADAGGSIGFYAEIDLLQTTAKCETVGLYDQEKTIQAFSISPNPVQKELMLTCNTTLQPKSSIEVNIYSVDGRLVSKELIDNPPTGGFRLDTGHLPQGLYYLSIRWGSFTNHFKFIKE